MKNNKKFTSVLMVALMLLPVSLLKSAENDLYGFGRTEFGELGIGLANHHFVPFEMANHVVQVAGGKNHCLFLTDDGDLWGVGSNDYGQLGNPEEPLHTEPVLIATNVAKMAADQWVTAYVKNSGELYLLGRTSNNLRGHEQYIDSGVVDLAVGISHLLFVKENGVLWGIGSNHLGQLGLENMGATEFPVKIAGNVVSVATCRDSSYFVRADGVLYGMGDNMIGQLGDNSRVDKYRPVRISGDVRKVVAGEYFAAYIRNNGVLYGMGDNDNGQLGNNVQGDMTLVPVMITSGVVDAVAGANHLLFIHGKGQNLYGLGSSYYGQLASEENHNSNALLIDSRVTSIGAGGNQSYYVKTGGTLYGIGNNVFGAVSDGTRAAYDQEQFVMKNIAAVASGQHHSMIVTTKGELWATGDNRLGQHGDGTTQSTSTPHRVLGVRKDPFNPNLPGVGVVSVAVNRHGSFYIDTKGDLYATGRNNDGCLGLGDLVSTYSPVRIASDVAGVSAQGPHTLFWTNSGELWGMGKNNYNQLGDGTEEDRSTPVLIARGVRSAAVGVRHSLYVTWAGEVFTMGDNSYGQIGDGSSPDYTKPYPVPLPFEGVVEVAAGSFHSLFRTEDGLVYGMGNNGNPHELGLSNDLHNGYEKVFTPVKIAGKARRIAASGANSYYINTRNDLFGAGNNYFGQIGNGTMMNCRFSLAATDVDVVSASGTSCMFTLIGDTQEQHEYDQVAVTDLVNLWPLDPSGKLHGKISYSVSGSLPDGLKIENGFVVGAIEKAATYKFSVIAKSEGGDAITTDFSLNVYKPSDEPLFLGAYLGNKYLAIEPISEKKPTVAGNVRTLEVNANLYAGFDLYILSDCEPETATFELSDGKLPEGLSLDSQTGAITGIPTSAGKHTFSITMKDKRGKNTLDLLIIVE